MKSAFNLPLQVNDPGHPVVVILDAEGNWIARVDAGWAGPWSSRAMAAEIVEAVNARGGGA